MLRVTRDRTYGKEKPKPVTVAEAIMGTVNYAGSHRDGTIERLSAELDKAVEVIGLLAACLSRHSLLPAKDLNDLLPSEYKVEDPDE